MISRRISEMDGDPFGVSAGGHRCFLCGEFLNDPVIMWAGANGEQIYLHGPCVIDWLPGLLRDVHELKHRSRTGSSFHPQTKATPAGQKGPLHTGLPGGRRPGCTGVGPWERR